MGRGRPRSGNSHRLAFPGSLLLPITATRPAGTPGVRRRRPRQRSYFARHCRKSQRVGLSCRFLVCLVLSGGASPIARCKEHPPHLVCASEESLARFRMCEEGVAGVSNTLEKKTPLLCGARGGGSPAISGTQNGCTMRVCGCPRARTRPSVVAWPSLHFSSRPARTCFSLAIWGWHSLRSPVLFAAGAHPGPGKEQARRGSTAETRGERCAACGRFRMECFLSSCVVWLPAQGC